jgi:hypothetical protein
VQVNQAKCKNIYQTKMYKFTKIHTCNEGHSANHSTYNEYSYTENLYNELYSNRTKQLRFKRRLSIMCWGKKVLNAMRFKSLPHIMNIHPLKNYIPSFIQIQGKKSRFKRTVLNTSRGKIVLTTMRFQWLSHIRNISPLGTYITRFIETEGTNYELDKIY